MGVFKAYDIRGTVPDQINEELFKKIGLAAVKVLNAKQVVVGRDMRESSTPLGKALIKGLTQGGADVIDIGMSSTPMLYFATAFCKADGGIQITASHNPAEYNGCKFCREDAIPVAYDTGLGEIEKLVESGTLTPGDEEGSVETRDVGSDYRAHLLKFAGQIKPQTVIVDAGNGVMGAFVPPLFAKLPCELIRLYFEPDGTFPNHEANPLKPENVQDLIARVKETGADLGVALDGDGDRSIYVDERGNLIPCDALTALIAAEMLEREPGATIIFDLRSSWIVAEEIERLGGTPIKSRVGHSYIKATMREHNAVFAGELSGHFYFRDIHYTDNAEMAMLTVLTLMSKTGKPISELLAPYRKYYATGEINFEVQDKDTCLRAVEEAFGEGAKEVLHLDGLSIEHEDWWCNVRPSNTEPVLRLNLEARTPEFRDAMREKVEATIRSAG
jgi:phosphomannomutase